MNRVYCATSGEVVEWPKALVLKTRDGKLSVGSNPTLSANYFYSDPNYLFLLRPQLFLYHCQAPSRVIVLLILPKPTALRGKFGR